MYIGTQGVIGRYGEGGVRSGVLCVHINSL